MGGWRDVHNFKYKLAMHKKTIVIVIILGVLSLLAYLGYKVITKTQEKANISKQLQTIPEFEFLTMKDELFSNKNLKPNLPTIFIYFNSECDFCQHEAQTISDHIDKFKAVQFVFVSTEPIETIRQFSEYYHLSHQQNITFIHDKTYLFSSRFDATSIPYILIYDSNQKLLKKHKGQLNANGILKVLDQND